MYKLFISLRYLRTTRVAVLPIACVTIGVVALLLVTSVMGGFSRDLRARIRGTTSHIAVLGMGGTRNPFGDWEKIAEVLRGVPGVVGVAPHLEWPVLAGQRLEEAQLIGIDPSLESKVGEFGDSLLDGKTCDFTLDGVNQDPPGAIVGCDMIGHYRSRDTVIVLDKSDAVGGEKAFNDARYLVRSVLHLQNHGDRFALLAFGGGLEEMPGALVERDARTVEKAGSFLDRLALGGEPNTLQALHRAMSLHPPGDRTFRIVVVSSGKGASRVSGILNSEKGRDFWGTTVEEVDALGTNELDVRQRLTGAYRGIPVNLVSGRLAAGNFISVHQQLTVVGLFKSGMAEYDSNYIYVPLQVAQKMLGVEGKVNRLCVAVDDFERAGEVRDKVKEALSAAGYDRMNAITWEVEKSSFLRAVALERGVTTILIGCVIVVAGFCVLAIMLMLVREKTRDIGILRALGATWWGIAITFLLEGFLIGFTGAALGCVIGFDFASHLNEVADYVYSVTGWTAFPKDLYLLDKIPTVPVYFAAVVIGAFAVLVSMAASVYPALKAAFLDPVESLRYE